MSAPSCPSGDAPCVQSGEQDCKVESRPVVVPVSSPSAAHVHSQKLSVLQLTAICFFAVAGGPFGFEEAIGSAGATWAYVGLVVLPLIWSIPIALMTAELATFIPDIGGQITWVERGLGPTAGFANSMLCLLTTFSDNAIYPVMFMDYLNRLKGGSELSTVFSWLTRTGVVALCALLNIRGVDVLGDATISFAVIVMTPFVIMACMGFMTKATSPPVAPKPIMWGSFLSTMMWSTSGFDSAGTCAADVKDPGRTFPKAVGLSVILVIASYIIPISAALKVMPNATLWEDGTWVTAAEILAGPWLATWVAVAAMVSNVGILSTMLCTTSRQLVGIADNGHLPFAKFLSKEHPSWETPYVMIIFNATISLIFTSLDFEGLAQVTTVFYSASTIMRFISLWRLRYTEADAERPFTIPGGTLGLCFTCIPPIALSVFAASQCESTELITVFTCMVGVLLATLAYALCVRCITPASTSGGRCGRYTTLEETEANAHKPPAVTCIEIPRLEPNKELDASKVPSALPCDEKDALASDVGAEDAESERRCGVLPSSPKQLSLRNDELCGVLAAASSTPRVQEQLGLSLATTDSHDDGLPLLPESTSSSETLCCKPERADNARR